VDAEAVMMLGGDILTFSASAEGVVPLRSEQGIRPLADDSGLLGRKRRYRRLYEAVLDSASPLTGAPLDNAVASSIYEAVVLAVRPGGAPKAGAEGVRGRGSSVLGDEVRLNTEGQSASMLDNKGSEDDVVLQRGDTILVEATPQFAKLYGCSGHFALVRVVEGSKPPRHDECMDSVRKVISVATLITMVIVAATNVLSLLSAAIIATFIMVGCKCITMEEAFSAIKGRTILAIVFTFGVSTAMNITGVADFAADGIVALCTPFGPRGLIAAVFLVGAVVGCVVSNNATVILMLPVCQSAAASQGMPFKQLVITLLMAASASFLTPISYQTNLMVYGPGGYSFSDYTKFGAPLVLGLLVLCTIFVPILY